MVILCNKSTHVRFRLTLPELIDLLNGIPFFGMDLDPVQ
jgi:hypothetical protein